jgi:hypothetical protein
MSDNSFNRLELHEVNFDLFKMTLTFRTAVSPRMDAALPLLEKLEE